MKSLLGKLGVILVGFIKMCQNTPPSSAGGMNGLPSPLEGEG